VQHSASASVLVVEHVYLESPMRSRSTLSESVPAKVILESISNYSMTEHGCTTNEGDKRVAVVDFDVKLVIARRLRFIAWFYLIIAKRLEL
jgi:hypothetical protein